MMATPLEEILMRGKKDESMIKPYLNQYPWLKEYIDSPQGLMQLIDTVHTSETKATAGGGTPMLHKANVARNALNAIYGINDYTPKGFLKWDTTQNNWVDPRPFMNDKNPLPRWIPDGELNLK